MDNKKKEIDITHTVKLSTWVNTRLSYNENSIRVTDTCGFCGGNDFETLETIDHENGITYVRCRKCGTITFNKIVSDEKMNDFYANYLEDSTFEQGDGSKVTFYGQERFAKHLTSLFGKQVHKKHIRILDFGGSDGSLAITYAKDNIQKRNCRTAEVHVRDFSPNLNNPQDARIDMKWISPDSGWEEKYDVIIASGVLNLLSNPGEILRNMFLSLNPGGVIYIRTSYVYPLFKMMKSVGKMYDIGYPGHLFDMGGSWWNTAAKYCYDGNDIRLMYSRPSIVEMGFREHPILAGISYAMKSVWWISHKWNYVGGWEVVYCKDGSSEE